MTDTARTNGIHPAIADHYEAMNDALHQRDQWALEISNLRSEKAANQHTIEFLKNQLDSITKQRDHYMRYSFALSTRINAMQDILSATMDLSAHEADNPSPAKTIDHQGENN